MFKHTLITLAAATMLIAFPSVLNLNAKYTTPELVVLNDVSEVNEPVTQTQVIEVVEVEETPVDVDEVVETVEEIKEEPKEVIKEVEKTETKVTQPKEEVKIVTPTQPKKETKTVEPTPTQPKVESATEPTEPTPTPEPTPAPAPAPVEEVKTVEPVKVVEQVSTTPAATWELEVLRLTNIERQKAGLSLLKYNTSLDAGAKQRSIEIITHFSHTRPDGSRFFTVFGPDFTYRNVGENLGSGYRTPEQVVNAWMNSTSHRANILNEKFEELSVAITKGEDGKYRWVQIFYRAR
ncbi:MAG: CAP domain-containing protein [Trichloromonadaceae bacterium]